MSVATALSVITDTETQPTFYKGASEGEIASNLLLPVAEAKESTPNLASYTPVPVSGIPHFLAAGMRIYEVQEGDTMSGIAEEFGVNTQTIKTANNINNEYLKVGDKLFILPDNGIFLKTNSNTTLPDIAKKYKTTVEQLIVDNGLKSAEDIPDLVFCYNCKTQENTYRAAVIRTEFEDGTETILEPNGNIAGSHLFPEGYCTYYVAKRMLVKFGGNAKNWLANAKAAGYKTGNAPIQGAAVVTTEHPVYWHVAYVEQVKGDSIIVSEMNYDAFNKINKREISMTDPVIKGYIYPLETQE